MELFNSIFLWCVIRYVITYVILYTEIKKPFKRVKSSFEPTVKSNAIFTAILLYCTSERKP